MTYREDFMINEESNDLRINSYFTALLIDSRFNDC